jgi:hypothetical protein
MSDFKDTLTKIFTDNKLPQKTRDWHHYSDGKRLIYKYENTHPEFTIPQYDEAIEILVEWVGV